MIIRVDPGDQVHVAHVGEVDHADDYDLDLELQGLRLEAEATDELGIELPHNDADFEHSKTVSQPIHRVIAYHSKQCWSIAQLNLVAFPSRQVNVKVRLVFF